MRASLYIRVSTEEQAREGFSIPAQRDVMEAFCHSQGWTVSGEYADEGFSAKTLNRPALQRLIADAQAHLMDVVLVWKLDRISRRQVGVLHLIDEVFEPNGVGFRSVTQQFDTTNPAGKAMLGMLAVFAELEHATIIERSKFGYKQRITQGQWAGAAPYGYQYGHNGALQPDSEAADWVRAIYARAIDGDSLDRIVDFLVAQGAPRSHGKRRQRWHPSTVKNILRNRVYLGERRTRDGWIKSGHPPLIDEATWLDAQDALDGRRTGPGRPRRGEVSPYLLTGLIYCGECGNRMVGHRNSQGARYYICDRIKRLGKRCGPGYVRTERLDEKVAKKLQAEVRAKRRPPATSRKRQSDVAAIDRKIANLISAIEDGTVPREIVRARLEELQRQRVKAQREQGPTTTRTDQARVLAAGLPRIWEHAEHAERREILHTLLESIVVDINGDPHLTLRK